MTEGKRNFGTAPIEKHAEGPFGEWFDHYQKETADEAGAVIHRTDEEMTQLRKAFFAGWVMSRQEPDNRALMIQCPHCQGVWVAETFTIPVEEGEEGDTKEVKGYRCLSCGYKAGPRVNISDLEDWQLSIVEGLRNMYGDVALREVLMRVIDVGMGRWHKSKSTKRCYEYLGMTEREYNHYMGLDDSFSDYQGNTEEETPQESEGELQEDEGSSSSKGPDVVGRIRRERREGRAALIKALRVVTRSWVYGALASDSLVRSIDIVEERNGKVFPGDEMTIEIKAHVLREEWNKE